MTTTPRLGVRTDHLRPDYLRETAIAGARIGLWPTRLTADDLALGADPLDYPISPCAARHNPEWPVPRFGPTKEQP